MTYALLAVLFVLFAGVFDAAQTAKKDYCYDSIFVKLLGDNERFMRWYVGGNDIYSPNMPWTADWWHFCKFMWIYCWSIAVGFACMADLNLWQAAIVTLTAQFVEGTTFSYFYSVVFDTRSPRTTMQFIKSRFR